MNLPAAEHSFFQGGFLPNVFKVLAHRPEEFRAFFAYYNELMNKETGVLSLMFLFTAGSRTSRHPEVHITSDLPGMFQGPYTFLTLVVHSELAPHGRPNRLQSVWFSVYVAFYWQQGQQSENHIRRAGGTQGVRCDAESVLSGNQ